MKIEVDKIWKVTIIESERGWGRKIIGKEYFTEESEASERCKEINSRNTSKEVPDYYISASYV